MNNTRIPLKSALLSFFQVGVMPPHDCPIDYEPPRPQSVNPIKPRRRS
jgi:hypothetical protein